ncbi:MAG: patatin-like phospholipase family protein [Betaproteobacteria bacterium]
MSLPDITAPAPAGASRATRRKGTRVGLALAGGGPLGAIWEIGALCALEEALVGIDFTRMDGYVGISAGGFIGAGLANGMTPRQMCAAFIENEGGDDDLIHPSIFVHPAWGEYAARLKMLPKLLAQAALRIALGTASGVEVIERLGHALPTGVFATAPIEAHLRAVFSAPGRTDDFRKLGRRLVLVATDLDTGAVAPFGLPGWDDVPISRAVTASAALPGLYPPVHIDGRHYVDGALKKTLHARVLLDDDIDLVLCLNPLVPFDSTRAPTHNVRLGTKPIPRLVAGGLPLVASQSFRSLIHSRLALGIRGYGLTHPDVDIALFEPDQRDPEMFGANTFSYSARRELAEHAYQSTRNDLRKRRRALHAMFEPHGIAIADKVLDDVSRRLVIDAPRLAPGWHDVAPDRLGGALRRLGGVLDELESSLATA